MNQILANLQRVKQRIHNAEIKYSRTPNSVMLLPVSKKHSISAIKTVADTGLDHFAENHVQEALPKIHALADLNLHWHFIGTIQSNKTDAIAKQFSWIHSIDRKKIAQRINNQRPTTLPPVNVCIQVNISVEPQKSGVLPVNCLDLAQFITQLPQLKLRGLMCIPAPSVCSKNQLQPYSEMHKLFQTLQQAGLKLDTLSMGMSQDLEAAIAEQATIVRVGSAIFNASPITNNYSLC